MADFRKLAEAYFYVLGLTLVHSREKYTGLRPPSTGLLGWLQSTRQHLPSLFVVSLCKEGVLTDLAQRRPGGVTLAVGSRS